MEDITFLRPHLLMYLAGLLPLVAVFFYVGFLSRKKARASYGEEKLVNRFSKPLRFTRELLLLAGWLVVVTLLVVAAAGPVQQAAPTHAKSGSLQVIAVVDVSRSMAAEDYRDAMPPRNGVRPQDVRGAYGHRLDYVKHILLSEVMPAIHGNQLDIVVYTGQGFSYAEAPTDDFTSLKWVLSNPRWMQINGAPGGGSDFAEGLREAVNNLKANADPMKEQVILLFSDGGWTVPEDKAGEAQEMLNKVLEEIRQRNIRLVVVGIGSRSPVTIPVYSSSGELTGYFKKGEEVVTTVLDENNLRMLQAASGGEYVYLGPGDKLGIEWASKIAGSKVEINEKLVYQYPLAVAMFLVMLLSLRGIFSGRRDRLEIRR